MNQIIPRHPRFLRTLIGSLTGLVLQSASLTAAAEEASAKKYVVLVETVRTTSSPPVEVPDYAGALEIIERNMAQYALLHCLRKLNRQVEDRIWSERKNVKSKTAYILGVDPHACAVVALVRASQAALWSSDTVLHSIDLYPIITLPSGREF
jgi:hypothetical protein